MNISDFEYCNYSDYAENEKILKESFEIPDFTHIKNAYKSFKTDFQTEYSNEESQLITINRNSLRPRTDDNNFNKNYYDENYTIGMDLPVLIKNKTSTNKKFAFIVSEDPLREKQSDPNIILSTPFGSHLYNFRNNKCKIYFDYAIWLFDQGITHLYFTDIKKIWVKEINPDKKTQKKKIPQDLQDKFDKTLLKEMNVYKPSVIITFGKDAGLSIDRINTDIRTIKFIHPTFQASKHWIRQYGLPSAKAAEKLNYMQCKYNDN